MKKLTINFNLSAVLKVLLVTLLSIPMLMTISPAAAMAEICPEELVALANWYETSPDYCGVSTILMDVTLENNDRDLTFDSDPDKTFQLWSTPSVDNPPVEIVKAPSGIVPLGENFEYKLLVDVSDIPATEKGLAFRAVSKTSGTMSPSAVPLQDSTFQCCD